MTNELPTYGYRVEGGSNIASLANDPFYFTKSRPCEDFENRVELKIPKGMKVAGVWFFNGISELKKSGVTGYPLRASLVTRIHVSKLDNIQVISDELFYANTASVAVSYYDPAVKAGDKCDSFARSLHVPKSLIDVWDGKKWVKKDHLTLLGMYNILHKAEWGDYKLPTVEEAKNPKRVSPDLAEEVDWTLPPQPKKKKRRSLFRRMKHAGMLRDLSKQQEAVEGLYFESKQLAFAYKRGGKDFAAALHQMDRDKHAFEIRKIEHQKENILTGTTFWQRHDVKAWAQYMMRLKRIDGSMNQQSLVYNELPDLESQHHLRKSVKALEGQALNARCAKCDL